MTLGTGHDGNKASKCSMVITMEVYLSVLVKYFNILPLKYVNFNVVNFKIINPRAKKN